MLMPPARSSLPHLARLLLALVVAACRTAPQPAGAPDSYDVLPLSSAPPGLSDLTRADHGRLWAVAERDRALVEIKMGKHAATARLVPIDGVPDGVDTEGIVALGEGRFAVSFEGKDEPTAGLLWIERRGDRAVVTATRQLTSDELGVTLTNNHGAEAVCGTADDLLVGIEAVGTLPDGTRYAPIARLRGDTLTVIKLRLTSAKGKLSALDCRIDRDGDVHAWGIERHFGVTRILRIEIPDGATEVTPTIAADLSAALHNSLNLEGIIAMHDGSVVVVNDNQSKVIEAPNELLVFHHLK